MPGRTKAEIKEKFANEDYPIHIVGRHIEVTEPMKTYAIEKLRKLGRFGERILEATITMDVQKLVHTVDIIVYVNNTKIKVSGSSETMYASLDMAIARLQTKLNRYLDRLHTHHAKPLSEIELDVNVLRSSYVDELNDEIEEANLQQKEKRFQSHKIVKRDKKIIKMLTQEEAIMKMDLSEDPFLIYKGEEDQKLKVMYRHEDGNYSVIEVY